MTDKIAEFEAAEERYRNELAAAAHDLNVATRAYGERCDNARNMYVDDISRISGGAYGQ